MLDFDIYGKLENLSVVNLCCYALKRTCSNGGNMILSNLHLMLSELYLVLNARSRKL
ncbi:hypothetical protein Fmac_015447 [Flemingia macrophylla]|uniref:Uncharacterized protein n=1 Tax=Flemingia macrophylla TaxID=520843 RepID=A0ABD1MER6_9FABA